MTPHVDEPRCFEDVEVGDVWRTAGRTVTETDIVMFAGLTGDYDPLHVDHRYAATTLFGRPVAHGLFGLSLVAGLGSRWPAMRTIAFVRIVEWKFLQPVYSGDTVHAECEVQAKTPHGRRRGLITWRRRLINSETGAAVQEGLLETLVAMRGARETD